MFHSFVPYTLLKSERLLVFLSGGRLGVYTMVFSGREV